MSQEKPLNEKIIDWLLTQGYPLEMKVATTLRNSGFRVQHSAHYNDPETAKSREIDIVCTISDPTYGMLDINFVIECKSSKKPWIIFTAEYTRENTNALRTLAYTSEKAKEFLIEQRNELKTSTNWIATRGRLGYSVTQAFTEGQDNTYDALLSTVKASLWLRKQNELQREWRLPFFFAFPVIITAAPLFECYLDDEGKVNLQEINSGTVFFDNKIEKNSAICVRIFNENSINDFKSDITKISDLFQDLLKEEIKTEWDNWLKTVQNAPPPDVG